MKTGQAIFFEVIEILERIGIPYMIGGSVASIAYGEPRLTLDMDVVVDLRLKQVTPFVQSFGPEYYVSKESIEDAIANHGHFNIIQSEVGVKVDFYILPGDAMNRLQFSRKVKGALDEKRQASFASPEDVILKKLEWYKMGESQKHLDDIKGILRISGAKLDMAYIDQWATTINALDIWQILKNTA